MKPTLRLARTIILGVPGTTPTRFPAEAMARLRLKTLATPFAVAIALLILPNPVAAQTQDGPSDDHMAAPMAVAVRIESAITIDGRLDESAWSSAQPITGFTQVEPDEGAPLSQRSEVRVLYDDTNLYIGAWLFDEGPVTTRLARRDANVVDTDLFVVFVDSYHDHRTAFRFTTNPSSFKRDEMVSVERGFGPPNPLGLTGDTSWDPVWEVSTSVTDEGWFVEIKIPFSQLRFSQDADQLWGIQFERRVNRTGEFGSWAFTPRRDRGGIARFGHIDGIGGIPPASRLELLPYFAGRLEMRDLPTNSSVDFDNPFRSGTDRFGGMGVDLSYGITSNLTLTATINPDFGQVEMDPAEINLTAFETRFGERRPFFVEGAEIFRFGEGGGLNTNLFYSRRIGRNPQGLVPGAAVYSDVPGSATILGAGKLTAKSAGGWSVGVLQAITAEERAAFADRDGERHRVAVEPLSNYVVGRVRRDLNEGRLSYGLIGTAVNRRLGEPALASRLHSAAYVGGVDLSLETAGRDWYLAGEFTPSLVMGEPEAILRTQLSSARYFQRPDAAEVRVDSLARSLLGYGAKFTISRQTGDWRGQFVATAIDPGFEVNDVGFQTQADRLDLNLNFGRDSSRPGRILQGYGVRFGPTATWNYDGDRIGSQFAIFGGVNFHNFYGFSGRIGTNFSSLNDRLTRGGPLTYSPASYSANITFNSDPRQSWTARLNTGFFSDDSGASRWNLGGNLSLLFREIYRLELGPSFSRNQPTAQYVTTRSDPTATHTFNSRYIFAPLDQKTISFPTRLNVTFTPRLTLEFYGEPFIASGRYGGLRELAAPGTFDFLEYGSDIGTIAREPDGRYTIDPDGPGGPAAPFPVPDLNFNVRSFNGNAVMRWEWRPGSTIFLVWQQTRSDRLTVFNTDPSVRDVGGLAFERDARDLFALPSDNVFMVKVNYWLNP